MACDRPESLLATLTRRRAQKQQELAEIDRAIALLTADPTLEAKYHVIKEARY